MYMLLLLFLSNSILFSIYSYFVSYFWVFILVHMENLHFTGNDNEVGSWVSPNLQTHETKLFSWTCRIITIFVVWHKTIERRAAIWEIFLLYFAWQNVLKIFVQKCFDFTRLLALSVRHSDFCSAELEIHWVASVDFNAFVVRPFFMQWRWNINIIKHE